MLNLLQFPGWFVAFINVTMSGGIDALALDEGDVTRMLVAATHIGNLL